MRETREIAMEETVPRRQSFTNTPLRVLRAIGTSVLLVMLFAANALAQQLAEAPTKGLARTKQALYEGWGRTYAEQLDVERDLQRELGYSADYVEGVAAFTQKRAAKFAGR